MHYGFLNEIFRDEFCVFSGLPSDKLIGRPEIAALNPCEAQLLKAWLSSKRIVAKVTSPRVWYFIIARDLVTGTGGLVTAGTVPA